MYKTPYAQEYEKNLYTICKECKKFYALYIQEYKTFLMHYNQRFKLFEARFSVAKICKLEQN